MTPSVSLLLLSLLFASSVAAQDIRARVVEDASRQPIAGATATLLSNNSVVTRATTDANGFFRIKPTAPGEYELAIEMLGYTTQRRPVSYKGEEQVVPAFVLKVEAIALDPLEATAKSRADSTAVVGFSRSSQLIAGARLARLEGIVSGPIALVREMSGLRTREFRAPSGLPVLCVEAVRRMLNIRGTSGSCQWPVIIVDGIRASDSACDVRSCPPSALFRELQVQDMESIEYMSPVKAGQQFGLDAGANGALVIRTRGRGPHKSPDRNKR